MMASQASLNPKQLEISYSRMDGKRSPAKRRIILLSFIFNILVTLTLCIFILATIFHHGWLYKYLINSNYMQVRAQQVSFVSLRLSNKAGNGQSVGFDGSIGPWEIEPAPASGGDEVYQVISTTGKLYGVRVLQDATYRIAAQITFSGNASRYTAGVRIWRGQSLLDLPSTRCVSESQQKTNSLNFAPCMLSRILSLKGGDIIELFSFYPTRQLAASVFNTLTIQRL